MKNLKALVLLSIVGAIVFACGDGNKSQVSQIEEPGDKLHPAQIELNEGNKWKADEATNRIMGQMADYWGAFESEGGTDFKTLADNMNTSLETLFEECQMQGAAHDALHQLLEPIRANIKVLQGENESRYLEAADNLRTSVYSYYDYFE